MAPSLAAAALELRDELRALDVRATIEPVDINPPCAYLTVKHIEDRHLAAGVITVEWFLYLVAQPGKSVDVLRQIDELRDKVLPAFRTNGIGEAVELALPGGGKPAPAIQCTIRTKVE